MNDRAEGMLGYVLVALIFAGTIAAAVVDEKRAEAKADKAVEKKTAQLFDGMKLSSLVSFGGVLNVPRKSPGTPWDAEGNVVFKKAAMVSLGDAASAAGEVELSLDCNDTYVLHWMYRARMVGRPATVGPSEVEGGGLAIYRVSTGAPAVDTVVVMAKSGDGRYSVGHVIPVQP